MKIRALTTALATSTVLVLALAACSSSGTASSPPGQAPGTGTGTGTGTQPASGGQAKKIDVCVALPASAASQITGATFTKTKSGNVEGVIFSCEYDGPDAALLQISFDTQNGKSAFDADVSALKAVGHAPIQISGVGDEAFSEPDPKGNAGSVGASAFASYGAAFGDTYINIGGLTYVTADQGKQIAEELHSKY